jgi:hypothetical protein
MTRCSLLALFSLLLIASPGCTTEVASGTEDDVFTADASVDEVVGAHSAALATCPVTVTCPYPSSGSGWSLTSTDWCPYYLTCRWGRFVPPYGSTITYAVTPAQCPVCRHGGTGSSGTCGVTDPPGSWICSAQ